MMLRKVVLFGAALGLAFAANAATPDTQTASADQASPVVTAATTAATPAPAATTKVANHAKMKKIHATNHVKMTKVAPVAQEPSAQ